MFNGKLRGKRVTTSTSAASGIFTLESQFLQKAANTWTRNNPTYSVSANTTTIDEGDSVTFTINTTDVDNGTTLYWTNLGTTTGADFSDSNNSGSFTITSNVGTVTRTLNSDITTEGSETVILQIRTGSTSGLVVATSSTVTVNDTSRTPAYNVTVNSTSINEGQSVTYTITTNNINSGTTLYWTNSGTTSAADFTENVNSGSFSVTGTYDTSTATVTLNASNDQSNNNEGSETLIFNLRTGSTSGTIVATAATVTIADTSKQTAFPFSTSFSQCMDHYLSIYYDGNGNIYVASHEPSGNIHTSRDDCGGSAQGDFVRYSFDKTGKTTVQATLSISGRDGSGSCSINTNVNSSQGRNSSSIIDYNAGAAGYSCTLSGTVYGA
jgi:hypothetical protein